KEKRRQRVARNPKTFGLSTRAMLTTKREHTSSRERKEDHVGSNDVIQDLLVTPGKSDDDGQSSLQGDRQCRHARAIQSRQAFEEQTVVGHRKINSRSGQHALT